MRMNRRSLLTAAAGVAATAVIAAPVERARRLRIAHLTDIHLQPELAAARGLAACFHHVQTRPAPDLRGVLGDGLPDLIVTGGDTIMDAFEADEARTRLQWELWRKVKADHCGMEIHSVIGNHDVWGWARTKSRTTGSEPRHGKRWVCDEFGRDLPYTSFTRGGWHVILLDSVQPDAAQGAESYVGRLDEPQWDWLERDLAALPAATPVIIFTHIPILSALPFTVITPSVGEGTSPSFVVQGSRVHVDVDRFQKLFAKHANIRACASGHVHLVERLEHAGVRYFCNGAVSAGWWKGRHRDTDFGYAVIDLFDDGTAESHYVPYGWTAAS